MTPSSVTTQVVIVGAGQAGLAVAYYLKRFELTPGTDFIIYDRGPNTGGAWQFRWDALKLGSAHKVNDLPGMNELGISFETADRSLPAKDIVAGYANTCVAMETPDIEHLPAYISRQILSPDGLFHCRDIKLVILDSVQGQGLPSSTSRRSCSRRRAASSRSRT